MFARQLQLVNISGRLSQWYWYLLIVGLFKGEMTDRELDLVSVWYIKYSNYVIVRTHLETARNKFDVYIKGYTKKHE